MSVHRAHVLEVHGLKHVAGCDRGFNAFLEVCNHFERGLAKQGKLWKQPFRGRFDFFVEIAGPELAEVFGHCSLRGRNAPFIIVKDNEELPPERARLVKTFERNSVHDARVAYNRDTDSYLIGWDEAARKQFFGRLLPVVRTFISFPAGVARMPFGRFLLYSTLGSFPWSVALVYLGKLLGDNWIVVRQVAHQLDYLIIAVIVFAVAFYVYKRVWGSKTSEEHVVE